MALTPPTQGRRQMLKARSRQAILDAASALVAERRGPHFTVEELAERADVSRATVFNYFPSLSDVLVTASVESFDTVSAAFVEVTRASPATDGSRQAVFEEVARSVRSIDLVDVAASVGAVLGLGDQVSAKQDALIRQVLDRTSAHFAQQVAARYPSWDRLEVALLVGALMNGIIVASGHWLESTGGVLDERSRAAWAELLERVIAGARSGYGHSD